jgi:hypothetical protein
MNPNSVSTIKYATFQNCSSLTDIQIPDSVKIIESFAFDGCTSLKNIQIPNSISIIKCATFQGCSSLTSIQIPNSVRAIEICAFKKCSSLRSIICNAIIPPKTLKGRSPFNEETYDNCQLLVPIESLDNYKESQYVWSRFKSISTNSEGVGSPTTSQESISHL